VLDSAGPAAAAPAGPAREGPTAARVEEHLALGDLEAARLAAVDLIAADPERAEGYVALGRALLRMARWEEADEALVQALHRDPAAAAPRRLLALAQIGQGRFSDAIESCDRWVRAESRSAEERGYAVEVTRVRDAAQALIEALRERNV
jgi:cytochrome c-type biogenesis protein CcmH/NrfG